VAAWIILVSGKKVPAFLVYSTLVEKGCPDIDGAVGCSSKAV
jgi:hypothetical protein